MAPPRSHRLFREWYVRALVEQLRAASRGESPTPPTPFADVLTAEVDRLPELEESQLRLNLLQTLTAELESASSTKAVATTVVDAVFRYSGIESVRIYELVDDQFLRSIAWHGRSRAADVYDEVPLDSDLPGAGVARTGRPLFLRSLAQIYDFFPDLEGYYTRERSLHITPLHSGTTVLGLLALTFQSGEISDDSQVAFVRSVTAVTARALERVRGLRGAQ
jgi:GAF domain-containing protein